MVRFLRFSHRPDRFVAACFLHLPPFGCRCFLQPRFRLEASSRLIPLCRRLLSTTSTSTAVWLPLLFRYGVFSISYYFSHLFRFVGILLRFLPFLFTWTCHLANELFFPSSHFLCGSRCSDLQLARIALHIMKKIGLVSPPSPPVSLPFSRGSNSTVLICFHVSNVFKVWRGPTHLGFRRCIFLGTGIQIHCMYFYVYVFQNPRLAQ